MKKDFSLKKHLDRIRKKSHEVLKKNGHFSRMAKASVEARRLKKVIPN